jgi:hypothetical protein
MRIHYHHHLMTCVLTTGNPSLNIQIHFPLSIFVRIIWQFSLRSKIITYIYIYIYIYFFFFFSLLFYSLLGLSPMVEMC